MTFDKTLLKQAAPFSIAIAFAAACSSARPDDVGSTAAAAGAVTSSWIDGNVQTFKPVAGSNVVYVQGTNGNLWREVGNMTHRTWVDGNVRAYQPIDGTVIYVLGTDGKLWREIGSMSNRTLVATGVSGFEVPTDGTEAVYYVDASNNLYRLVSGHTPTLLASSVRGFQWTPRAAVLTPALYVLHTDGTLWRGAPDATLPYGPIETNVSSFRAIDALTYTVEQNSTQLWLEMDTNGLGPNAGWGARISIDSAAEFFWPLDGATTFVEDNSFTLWRDEYGSLHRDRVDGNVKAYQPVAKDSVYVLHFDGNLYLETLADPPCNYRFSATHVPNTSGLNFNYIAAWGVDTHSTTCPNLAGTNGYWYAWNGVDPIPGLPTGFVAPPLPSCAGLTGLSPSCCLYVWQPTVKGAMQDPSVLCNADTVSMEAWVDEGSIAPKGVGGGNPNGGGCGTCDPTGTY